MNLHVIFSATKPFVKTDGILESMLLRISRVSIIMGTGFICTKNPIKQL